MSQAITNAAKAEVGLDRRIMQSYPLIYQSSAAVNESNAQISRVNDEKQYYKIKSMMFVKSSSHKRWNENTKLTL